MSSLYPFSLSHNISFLHCASCLFTSASLLIILWSVYFSLALFSSIIGHYVYPFFASLIFIIFNHYPFSLSGILSIPNLHYHYDHLHVYFFAVLTRPSLSSSIFPIPFHIPYIDLPHLIALIVSSSHYHPPSSNIMPLPTFVSQKRNHVLRETRTLIRSKVQ